MFPTQRVRRNLTDLEYLARAKQAVRSRHLADAPEDLILAIIDVAKALIRGKIKLTTSQLAQAKNNKRLAKAYPFNGGTANQTKVVGSERKSSGSAAGSANQGHKRCGGSAAWLDFWRRQKVEDVKFGQTICAR